MTFYDTRDGRKVWTVGRGRVRDESSALLRAAMDPSPLHKSQSDDWATPSADEANKGDRAPRKSLSSVCGELLCADPVFVFLTSINVVAVATALLAAAANIFVVVESASTLSFKDYCIRAYTLSFCVMLVLVELEWSHFMRWMPALENFAPKGLFFGLVGLLTLDVSSDGADGDDGGGDTDWGEWQNVIGILLVAVGAVYLFLGIVCFKYVADARKLLRRQKARGEQALLDVSDPNGGGGAGGGGARGGSSANDVDLSWATEEEKSSSAVAA